MILLNGKEITPTSFPDGTSQVWKLDFNKEMNGVLFAFENDAEIFHLLQLRYLLSGEAKINVLTMPYLPYGRQDKEVSNDATFALHPFISTLRGWTQIETLDVHSDEVDKWHWAIGTVRNYRPNLDFAYKYDFLVFPDKGAADRYSKDVEWMTKKMNKPVFYGEKLRDQTTGRILDYHISLPNGRGLVIDDICDGGATFNILAQSVKNRLRLYLDLYVSHGIFSKGVSTLLQSYGTIYTTNSFHYRIFRNLDDLSELNIAAKQSPLWADIKRAVVDKRLIISNWNS